MSCVENTGQEMRHPLLPSPQPIAAWGVFLGCPSSKESMQGEDAELYLLATMRGAITPIVKAAVWYMKTSERK